MMAYEYQIILLICVCTTVSYSKTQGEVTPRHQLFFPAVIRNMTRDPSTARDNAATHCYCVIGYCLEYRPEHARVMHPRLVSPVVLRNFPTAVKVFGNLSPPLGTKRRRDASPSPREKMYRLDNESWNSTMDTFGVAVLIWEIV